MKKILIACSVLLTVVAANATNKINFNYQNADITTIIQDYSKAAGQKFIVDSTVRGKITILNPSEVSTTEAFNQLSEALAVNGFAMVTSGDQLTVRNARSAQRDNLAVVSEVPAEKPQRMVTWVISLKNTAASDIMKEIRLLTSSYGEAAISGRNNQIIITDWSTNLQRVNALIQKVDIVPDPKFAKFAKENKGSAMKKPNKNENVKVEEKTETVNK
ncbi:general secretion pathway protein GspD [bacterium]|nr:general secretion pathway protein GspD [bacterium]